MLWTLVSKEPPVPADGTRDTGRDGGQQTGLCLNWAVPNVLVKDVPDFEQLSPELEAGTAASCLTRSPGRCPATGAWGRGPRPGGAHGGRPFILALTPRAVGPAGPPSRGALA